MSNYITLVKVNQIFHLKDLTISISEEGKKHLLLTGKNGSGKTSLLNAVWDFIEKVYNDENLLFLNYTNTLKITEQILERAKKEGNATSIATQEKYLQQWQKNINSMFGKVDVTFKDVTLLRKEIDAGSFIVAYYNDKRWPNFVEHDQPRKPDMEVKEIRKSKVDQFLDLLTHNKLQTAFAQIKGNEERVSSIDKWFTSIEKIFRELFDDDELYLDFDSNNYKFYFVTKGKRFKFTELSAGYSAALDIISDLIFKMQDGDKLVDVFDNEGIVLIDEIETHLHLELQRQILPLLTSVFPNIQFIVSTHSPFVLNSVDNSVAYDMERHATIGDLTNYSYESLAEGYFGVRTNSIEIESRLNRLEELMHKNSELEIDEQDELRRLKQDFESLPEIIAPSLKSKYYEIIRKNKK